MDTASFQATNAALVSALAGGDTAALGDLYDRLAPVMLTTGRRMLGDGREAEDLVHDVFLEVRRRAHSYRQERASVRTWVLMMLRSRALDHLRSAARVRRDAAPPLERLAQISDPTQDPGGAPDRTRVRGHVMTLRDEHRAVIELAYFRGLSSSAIARELEIPIGTAKSRMAAALRQLRTELRAMPEGA